LEADLKLGPGLAGDHLLGVGTFQVVEQVDPQPAVVWRIFRLGIIVRVLAGERLLVVGTYQVAVEAVLKLGPETIVQGLAGDH